MRRVYETNVSNDFDFRRAFNGFYIIRQRPAKFYDCFYEYMECMKGKNVNFENTITHFYQECGTYEASFSSKLVATLNPDMPIWDSQVLKSLELNPPRYSCRNRLERIIDLYDKIVEWYQDYMRLDNCSNIVEMFDKNYPVNQMSKTKKIDFVLWALGKNQQ